MRTAIAAMAATAAIILSSCSPTIQTTPEAPTRPPESQAIAPIAANTQAAATEAFRKSERLETEVAELHQASADVQEGMMTAVLEADRLRKQKAASEQELEALWAILTEEKARADKLLASAEKASLTAAEQREKRIAAEKHLSEMTTAANATQAELEKLREQHDQMAATIQAARRTEAALQGELDKARDNAAIGKAVKGSALLIGAVAALGGLVWVAIRSLKPPGL